SFTGALVTVTDGIIFGMLIILPICSALMPKTKTTMATSRPMATPSLRRRRGRTFVCVGTLEILFATSCISEFSLAFEQQAPQCPSHFELSRAPFSRSHFLGTQHIEHQHSARDGENKFCQFVWSQAVLRVLTFGRPLNKFSHAIHRGLQNIAHQIGHARIARCFRVKIDNERRDNSGLVFAAMGRE